MQSLLIEFGSFRVEVGEGRLWKDHNPIKLRAKNAAVLSLLTSRPQQLVTSKELMSKVWGSVVVSPVTLNQTILELRRKMDDHARSPRYIETVPRRGFRFIADWQPVEQDSTAAMENVWQPPIRRNHENDSTPIGRETEILQLTRLFETASTGRRQVVFVTGIAGIGKTHLVHQFLQERLTAAAASPIQYAVGHSVNTLGALEAYGLAKQVLNKLSREDANTLLPILKRLAPTWLDQIPQIADASTDTRNPLPQASPGRILRELCETFEEFSRVRPLVIWFEDMHWADYSCIDLISALATRSGPTKLLLIVTLRPSDAAQLNSPVTNVVRSLRQKGLCTEIGLEQLSKSDVARYLSQNYKIDGDTAELTNVIHQHSEGIPLFLTALINEFISGEPVDSDLRAIDATAMTHSLRQRGVETISEYVETQLTDLDVDDVELLEAASVAGLKFSVPAVAAALLKADLQVETECHRLARWKKFLEIRGSEHWSDGTAAQEYSFQHDVFRQVTYNRIPAGRRHQYHQRIGERIENGYKADTHAVDALLAHHFELGGQPSRAVPYLTDAGNTARKLGAPREAISFYEKALNILEGEHPSPNRDLQEASIRVQLNGAQTLAHGYGIKQLDTNFKKLLELPCTRENETQLATILLAKGRMQHSRAELRNSLATFSQALDLELPPDAFGLKIFAHGSKAMLLVWSGEVLLAEKEVSHAEVLDPIVSKLEYEALVTEIHLPFLCAKAYSEWLRGHPEQARATVDRLEALAAGLTRVKAMATSFSALLAVLSGSLSLAERLDQRARRYRVEHDIIPSITPELAPAGWILCQRGQLDSALKLLEKDLAETRQSKQMLLRSVHLATLAEVHLARKDVIAGSSTLHEALTFVEQTGEHFYEAELYRLRGEFEVLKGESEDARADFEQALDIARRQGALSLEQKAAVSLAALRKSEGK